MRYPVSICLLFLFIGIIAQNPTMIVAGAAVFLGGFIVHQQRSAKPHPRSIGVVPQSLVPLVRRYAAEIQNGRTPADIYRHYLSEHRELLDEWASGSAGEDGVVGEAIDIITCLLDLIIVSNPDMTDGEITALATKKLDKWKLHYSHSVTRDRSI